MRAQYDRAVTPVLARRARSCVVAGRAGRTRRRRDRRRRHHGLRVRARARRGRPARAARRRRRVAEGASGRNGGFALRGGGVALRRGRRDHGRDRASALWRWTEAELAGWARSPVTSFRRSAASGSPPTPRSGRTCGDELEALRADGFDAEWIDGPTGRSRALHGGDPPSRPIGARSPRAGSARSRRAPPRRAPRSWRDDRVNDPARARRGARGRRDRRLSERPPRRRSRGSSCPTRGQVIATEPLAERLFEVPHYGTPRLRLLAPGSRTGGSSRAASATSRSTREFTDEERVTDHVQARAVESFVDGLVGRELARRLPLGRDLRARPRLPAGGGRRCRTRRHLGRGRLLRPRERARVRVRRLVATRAPRRSRPVARRFEPARLLGA